MEPVALYVFRDEVKCLKCGGIGAIQLYGNWYENGIKERADRTVSLEVYRDKPFMSHALGFGGTIPYMCPNCKNEGLIDFGGLEGYKMAFETIKK